MPERTEMVDAVDWEFLAGGPTGVPKALHALWSGDRDGRQSAYQLLADSLARFHGCTPASIAAVPFLIDVVADPAAPDRFGACQVLRMIALGDESHWLVECPDPADDRARVAALSGADRDAAQGAVEAYDAVRAGVPVYLAALASDEPPVRLHAAHLLAWFPEERDTVVPALTRLIESEPAEYAEIAAVASVAAALAGGTAADTTLVRALNIRRGAASGTGVWASVTDRLFGRHKPFPPERWAASIALARVLGDPGSDVLEQVSECLTEAGDAVLNWPFLNGDMATLAALTLAAVPDGFDPLAAGLLRSDPEEDRALRFHALVKAAFPDGPLPDGTAFPDLTDRQKTAVRTLADAEAWREGWYIEAVTTGLGLPFGDDALRAWIG
ncbi:hypothetical protein Aca07nite_36950 [Actinoplanes capillaceus]|uniref:HEAT repeat-containing protein n=1 Tax=Actinoplanes campanulatus TaxID=113559 RepID=A0ABQ3WJK6_9ACTN|nr:hypothetical protein [Actinoplanes capillaceus]GID46420.1 hypothetical protein Aca07nite_36950 [Actinoplanes capillaceus]